MTKKYWERGEFKELQKEWYGKLSDTGFVDIESGKDETVARLAAKGHVKSVSLDALRSHLPRHSQEANLEDVLDSEHPLVQYQDSTRARFYRAASHVVSEAFRQGLPEKTLFVWQLCAEGVGGPTIVKRMWEDHSYEMSPRDVYKEQVAFKEVVYKYLRESEEMLGCDYDDE